jgi:EpsI family protein
LLTIPAMVVLVAFVWCYQSVLRLLVWQWYANDVYSYSFLIPGVVAYLVWADRERILAAVAAPSYASGLAALLLALAAVVVGQAGSLAVLQELSVLPVLFGLVLLAGGWPLARRLWFPMAYLLLTIPLWDSLTASLHRPFQLLTAFTGGVLLTLAQVPTFRVGTVLHLPTVTLEVARECSGVNYLISVVAVALPYVYLSIASTVRRVSVVLLAVAVAILANSVRVFLIGVLQHYGLPGAAPLHGPGHILQGMFVAAVGYVALFAGGYWIGRGERSVPVPAEPPVAPAHRPSPAKALGLWIGAALLAAGAVAQLLAVTPPRPLPSPASLPDKLAEWVHVGVQTVEPALRVRDADTEVSRTYRSEASGTIGLYIGYLGAQTQGHELVGYSGVQLPPGREQTLDVAGRKVRVLEVGVTRAGGPSHAAVWFDVNGRVSSSGVEVKLLTIWNTLLRRRSNGAVVVLTLEPAHRLSPEESRDALRRFATGIMPSLQAYLGPSGN